MCYQPMLVLIGILVSVPLAERHVYAQVVAQEGTATLSGVVLDETGAAISDAEVIVANAGTGLQRTARTDIEGTFVIPLLPAGRYVVRAQREGFAAAQVQDIVLNVSDVTPIRIQLRVASLNESVMVTARLREERLQDVPASVAAASGETISDLNIVEVTELDSIAPGLTFVTKPGRFGSGPAIAIRGVSTFVQSFSVQDSVGIVLDGVPISRAKAASFPDLYDLERVEVLRGPQGTLFGKNASAGVINITTTDPTNDFESEVRLGYGSYNDRTLRASVSGPLVENRLRGRISVYGKVRDGFVKNLFDDTSWDDDEQKGARGKLLFTPTSNSAIKVSGDFLQQNNDGGMQTVRHFLPTTPQYVRNGLGSIVETENDEINAHSMGDHRQRTGGVTLQWDHSFAAHTLTGVTGYRRWTQHVTAGTYGWLTPLNEGLTVLDVDSHQYSGELRIASRRNRKVDYVAGLFVFADEVDSGLHDPDPGHLVLSSDGVPVNRQQRNWLNEGKTFNSAAFGEADTRITDRVTLTTGLRWTREKVDVTIIGLPTTPGLQRLVVPLGTTTDSRTASNLSWRLGGQWRTDEDRMLYVSAATGWKGPGFNSVSAILGNAQAVNPENSTSFEGGVKSQMLDRRLTANVSVYRANYRDYQAQGFVLVPGSFAALVVLSNAGKLQTQGFEAELAARVSDTTDISFNATYIDATFREYKNAQCFFLQTTALGCVGGDPVTGAGGQQDLTGQRLANTPEWAFNVLSKHELQLPRSTWGALVTADYSWRSSVRWDLLGQPLATEGAYGLLGASLGFRSDRERLGIKIYGKNLTDQFHTSGIIVAQTVNQFLPADYRRTFGVEASFKF